MKIEQGMWFVVTEPPDGSVSITQITERNSYWVFMCTYLPPEYNKEHYQQLPVDTLLGHLGGAYDSEGYTINHVAQDVALNILHLLQRKLP